MERWNPIENLPEELFLDEIIDNYNGLTILLSEESSERVLSIQFGLHVLSYQSTAEHCVLKTLDDNPDLKVPWSLFKSSNSCYINWLIQESYKIIEHEQKVHYVIKHPDGIINVVSSQSPSVKWINKEAPLD